jgi:hypothetical protein
MGTVAGYFNLNLQGAGPNSSPGSPMSFWEQLTMYVGVLLGVIGSAWVDQYNANSTVSIKMSWATGITAAIIALVIIPAIYDKLQARTDAPWIVKFGVFVQNGVFWHVLLTAISKAAG